MYDVTKRRENKSTVPISCVYNATTYNDASVQTSHDLNSMSSVEEGGQPNRLNTHVGSKHRFNASAVRSEKIFLIDWSDQWPLGLQTHSVC